MDETPKNNNNQDLLSNFEPNVVAAFTYLFPFVTGIIFFILEKKNSFVRFHAVQSILFWLALTILWTVTDALYVVYIGYILSPLIRIGGTVLWLFLMWKAYKNEEYQLPYLGKIAKDQSK